MNPGSQLGPYEIRDKLGEGGMGAVYLADDSRLGRKVAIKVLPEAFATDPDRLARFEREARAAAALNHPHIAAVHDIGVEGDTHYLVQEYLEGETLRERLDRGEIPLTTALGLGAEIAEALDAAHDAGIVHRDLKPDNVFVTEQGHAKVLDFGLAKLTEKATPQAGDSTRSPTVIGTSAGAMMGTAGYMAPEQITGEEVDERADVFAFGCLLYEMVSGQRAFSGKNLPEILHRLANDEAAPLAESAPELPLEGRRIITKCLAKEPARRYQGMADLAVDLRRLVADIESGRAIDGVAAAEIEGRRGSPALLPATGLAGLFVGALLYAAMAAGPPVATGITETLYLPLPGTPGLDSQNISQMALSSDGRMLAFATGRGPARIVDLTRDLEPRALADTDRAIAPFFSPDGRWLAYLGLDERLYRIDVDGGRPQPFSERLVAGIGGARWYPSGEVLLNTAFDAPILRLAPGADRPEPVTEIDAAAREMGHGSGEILPSGRVLYSFWDDTWRIGVRDLETGERTVLAEGYAPRYVPTGHLVWAAAEQLMGARFDAESAELGEPVQLLSTLGSAPGWGRGAYDFADNGTMVYLRAPEDRTTDLIRVDPDGSRTTLHRSAEKFVEIAYAPSGERLGLASHTTDGDSVIYSYDIPRDDLLLIGQGDGWDQYPFFLPDGERIGWVSERLGEGDIFVRPADGSGEETPFLTGKGYADRPSWRASDWLVFAVFSPETGDDVVAYRSDDLETAVPVLSSVATEDFATLSWDGRWLAFRSDRAGRADVYVAPFEDGRLGAEWKVTRDGASRPRWTRDGGQLYYWSDGRVMRVEVVSENPLRTGEAAFVVEATEYGWDVAPDGSHVVITEQLAAPQPRLVLNWFAELERLLPAGR